MAQTTKKRLSTIRKREEEIMTKHISTIIHNYFMSGIRKNKVRHI